MRYYMAILASIAVVSGCVQNDCKQQNTAVAPTVYNISFAQVDPASLNMSRMTGVSVAPIRNSPLILTRTSPERGAQVAFMNISSLKKYIVSLPKGSILEYDGGDVVQEYFSVGKERIKVVELKKFITFCGLKEQILWTW